MDLFKPLGKRDIFGIVLPGTIVVFAAAYSLLGVLTVLQLSVGDLLGQQFLLSVSLFVFAYLIGSLLRMYVADDVDKESSKYLEKEWWEEHQAEVKGHNMVDYEKWKATIAKGDDISDLPDEFDDWLWRVEEFPYPAYQRRVWQAHGLCEVLNFFHEHHGTSMWSGNRMSPKSFFNYCKLVVIKDGEGLADEVNMAEGLTRFFAGTFIALQISNWLLYAALAIQLLFAFALVLAPRWGIVVPFPAQWIFQGFYLVLTLALVFSIQRMRHLIVKRFRHLRQRETEIVYHAFYLHSISKSDENAKKEQIILTAGEV